MSTEPQNSDLSLLGQVTLRQSNTTISTVESHTPQSVLLIDDEEIVRQTIKRVLERENYVVLEASGGESGLALFSQHRSEIDIVLLDANLHGMSGEETWGELRHLNPHLSIILMSGYPEYEITERLQASGGLQTSDKFVFLNKPFSMQELLEAIQKIKNFNR